MKNEIPFPDALERRLQDDAKRLPSPPADLHDRIMNQLDDVQIEARGSHATPWLVCAAAIALLIALGTTLLPQSPEPTPSFEQAMLPLPARPVVDAKVLNTLIEQPLQTEVQNLTQDVQSATRFLLTSFSAPISTLDG